MGTVTVDGQFRDRRDYYHISPGRQDATQGNSVLGLTFNLKPLEVVVAEQKKEELKLEASDDKDAKARSAAEQARKALMDAYNAGKDAIVRREALESRVQKALRREHLAEFVVAEIKERGGRLSLDWHVDGAQRRLLERTRLGRRVLSTDRHIWSTGRIAHAFRGQWYVEELFRRAKKGGVAPWGPSHQWSDNSLRLHTFATVIGLELVSLARLANGTQKSARGMMKTLSGIEATSVRIRAKQRGSPATVVLAPDLTREQQSCVASFELGRWMPVLLSSSMEGASQPDRRPAA